MAVYVMSDLHGQKEKFDRLLNKIQFNEQDHLYILGDVIDRGPQGIILLLETMKNDRITLLLGNHEHMMYTFLRRIKDECSQGSINEIADRWMVRNGGAVTFQAYQELDSNTQAEVYHYIENLPLIIPNLEVNNRKFVLVHSMANIINGKVSDQILTMKDIGYTIEEVLPYVWERFNPRYPEYLEDKTILAGHTVTGNYFGGFIKRKLKVFFAGGTTLQNAKYIDLDCGCALGIKGKLACLRLDDMKVFYD